MSYVVARMEEPLVIPPRPPPVSLIFLKTESQNRPDRMIRSSNLSKVPAVNCILFFLLNCIDISR